MMLLKINRLLPIYINIVPLKFEVDIQSQSKVRVRKPKKSNMAARRPFWKWHRWKSIGFCLWPPSTCIWNLKLKFQSKLDLCSGNHVVYRQTDGRTDEQTDKVNPVYPPSNFVGRGYNKMCSKGSISNTSALIEVIAWHWTDEMPLSEPMMVWITDGYFTGLVQERHNSIANALELCLSYTNPSICGHSALVSSTCLSCNESIQAESICSQGSLDKTHGAMTPALVILLHYRIINIWMAATFQKQLVGHLENHWKSLKNTNTVKPLIQGAR